MLWTLRGAAKGQRIQKCRDWWNAVAKGSRSRLNEIGRAFSTWSKKGQIFALLRRLSKSECRDQTRFLPLTLHIRVYRLLEKLRCSPLCTLAPNISTLTLKRSTVIKTVFSSHHGRYRLVQMSFGLKKFSVSLTRTMAAILASVKWWFTLFYSKNIAVFSRYPRKVIDHVRQRLERLRDAGVTPMLVVCNFFTEHLNTLAMSFVCDILKEQFIQRTLSKVLSLLQKSPSSARFLDYAKFSIVLCPILHS